MTSFASNGSMPGATARFPFNATIYERPTELSLSEQQALQAKVDWASAGKKGWPPGTKMSLASLLRPLYELLDHMGVTNRAKRLYTIRTSVIYLLIRAMHRHQCTFWAFSEDQWCDLLGQDYYAYARYHGVTANARHQLIGVAYQLCDFKHLERLGRLSYPALACKLLGTDVFEQSVVDLQTDLLTWGYTKQGNTKALRAALAEALLTQRSPYVTDLEQTVLE